MSNYIQILNAKKVYRVGQVEIEAVKDISFDISQGEMAVIVGSSGSGKTTVLNLLGGIDTCTSGRILVDGVEVNKLSQKQLMTYRRKDIGFVFQYYNLVQNLTALENVELATKISKDALPPRTVLEQVGLGDKINNFPSQLSGGEQQRVSIARAISKKPKLLLCDEPTGALDYNTGKDVLKLLINTCKDIGMTVVLITHNLAITPIADRIIRIKNGMAEAIEENSNPMPVELVEW